MKEFLVKIRNKIFGVYAVIERIDQLSNQINSTNYQNKISDQNSQKASKDISTTTEYFIPQLGLDLHEYIVSENKQGIHHLGRYYWAIEVIRKYYPNLVSKDGFRLLDIACGAGYGSFLIGKNFPNSSVIGGDYDERAISYAKNNYRLANLQFAKANIVTWSYENITNIDQQNNEGSLGKFDVILCFDTIEHLLHRETALKNLTENLADDGFLLLSTPCGHKETLLNPGWEHHKIEYSSTDLFDFLSRHFAEVLRPEDGNLPAMDFWLNVINKDKIRYLNKTNPVCCRKPIKIRS